MTYQINRRTALAATASLLLSRDVSVADSERALFWMVTPPGSRNRIKGTVVFGYERIAAAAVLDIVKYGDALVAASQRIVIDMPQNVQLQGLKAATSEFKPILQVVSPQTADRLRKFLSTTPIASTADRVPGILVESFLVSEGQHDPNVPGQWEENGTVTRVSGTVGAAIFANARNLGKPVEQLLSEAEVRSGSQPPNLVAINNSVGDNVITYLLDLRDRVGPIGSYLEQLYRQRRGEDWVRAQADITRRGGSVLVGVQWAHHLRDMLIQRAVSALMEQADEDRFMFFELYPLVSPSGLLAALKAKGAVIAARA